MLESSSGQLWEDSNSVPFSSSNLPGSDANNIFSYFQQHPTSVSHSSIAYDNVDEGCARRRAYSAGANVMKKSIEVFRRGRTAASEGGHSVKGSRSRGISLPRHAISPSISSSSSDQSSPLTPAHSCVPSLPDHSSLRNVQQARHSLLTQQSGTSSSLYPRSSVTHSGIDSVLPLVVDPDNANNRVHIFDPQEQSELRSHYGFDADDVSYRLQLLVKNNYYLPPAHKKPFIPDVPVISDNSKKSLSKTSAPAFLDLFKLSRSRPKVTSPTKTKFPKSAEGTVPILRTTSDSSTISVYRQQPTTRSLPSTPLIPPQTKPVGRVVVVRERMEDVATAAKQAERDLKIREKERKHQRSSVSDGLIDASLDNIVDPTDAVDIPPPKPEDYPFAPQASALNALGIEASIGAAVLAERLPPANEWSWTMDAEEDSWRKALLHEAVSHSLNNSVNDSSSSSPAILPSVLERNETVSSNSSASTSSTLRRKRQLGQRILPHIPDEEVDRLTIHSPKPYAPTAEETLRLSNCTDPHSSLGMFSLPGRVETPIPPPQPLAPPPRKACNSSISHISLSGSEGHRNSDVLSSPRLPWTLRKTMSDPALSNTSDMHSLALSNRPDILTPPPSNASSQVAQAHINKYYLHPNIHDDAASTQYYSDDQIDETVFHSAIEEHSDAEEPSRPSLTISTHSVDRASSEYTQPLSRIRDTMISPVGDSVVYQQWHRAGIDSITRASSTFGEYVSPPPRTSSAFSHHALTPAPRSRVMYGTMRSQVVSPGHASASQESMSSRGQHSFVTHALHELDDTEERDENEVTQTEAPSIRHTNLAPPQEPHGSREPPSPISFFDEVEMQHGPSGRSDILNSSIFRRQQDSIPDDDTSDTDNHIFVNAKSDFSETSFGRQSGSSLMRLSNRSSPYILTNKGSAIDQTPVSFSLLDRRRAIMNTAGPSSTSNTFPSNFDVEDTIQASDVNSVAATTKNQRPSTSPSEQSGTGLSASGLRPRTAVSEKSRLPDSSALENDTQRLDGLLLEHIEKEKDTLRRITSTLTKS